MKKPHIMEDWPISVDGDYEVLVNVHFHYYPGHIATRHDPPEAPSVEIVRLEYSSGARNEVEEEIFMATVRALMDVDGEWLAELEEACLEWTQDMEDAMMDRYYDMQMEALHDRQLE